MGSLKLLLGVALGCIHVVSLNIDKPTYKGCYSDAGSLKKLNESTFQSSGKCHDICVIDPIGMGQDAFSVQAMTKGTHCYCGNSFPNNSTIVSDDKCGFSCPGYPKDTCGERLGHYFSMYLSGIDKLSNISEDPLPTNTSTTASPTPTAISSSTSTDVTPTFSAIPSASSEPQSGVVSKAGVAAGVVVGVLVASAIGLGAWLLLRRRRRQQVEEEYRKSAAVRGFVQKPLSDHRLDPSMVQKRDSVGSIADNQDYSRRILKVTNPDG